MSLLRAEEIEKAVASGEISITPFDKKNLKEGSYTFTLGTIVRKPKSAEFDAVKTLYSPPLPTSTSQMETRIPTIARARKRAINKASALRSMAVRTLRMRVLLTFLPAVLF
jgi:hypothetical protein